MNLNRNQIVYIFIQSLIAFLSSFSFYIRKSANDSIGSDGNV